MIAVLRKNSKNSHLFQKEFPAVKIVMIDMDEYNKIASYIDKTCDVFISLAWDGTRGDKRQDCMLQENNYKSNLAALKSSFELGIKTFVTAGSQAEYGYQNGLVSEEYKERPITAYGQYKLRFYNEAQCLCKKNNVRILEPRFFSLYGIGDYSGTLIMSTICKMKLNKRCEFSDCEQNWNFLYVKDAVDAIIYLIMDKNIEGGVYNFANRDTRKLKDFIFELKKITGTKSELIFGALPHNDSGNEGINPDVSKIYSTGWRDRFDFRRGIVEILNGGEEKMQ